MIQRYCCRYHGEPPHTRTHVHAGTRSMVLKTKRKATKGKEGKGKDATLVEAVKSIWGTEYVPVCCCIWPLDRRVASTKDGVDHRARGRVAARLGLQLLVPEAKKDIIYLHALAQGE